jgi:hypothetical protein
VNATRTNSSIGWRGWTTALSLIAVGAVALAVEAAAGNLASGLGWFAALAGFGLLLGLGGRYRAVRVARGDGGDEREDLIELKTMAAVGTVVVTALAAAVLAELLREGDPAPYAWILAVGGVTYVGAWAWLRRRS